MPTRSTCADWPATSRRAGQASATRASGFPDNHGGGVFAAAALLAANGTITPVNIPGMNDSPQVVTATGSQLLVDAHVCGNAVQGNALALGAA
jgi:hypothetical protein